MRIIIQDNVGDNMLTKHYIKTKWNKYKSILKIKIKRIFGWNYPCYSYGMDKLIKDILLYTEDYDPYYPEHKPIGQKLKEQTGFLSRNNHTEESYIRELIINENKYFWLVDEDFKNKHGDNWVFEFYYQGLDFWITENYCWTTDKKDAYEASEEYAKDMERMADAMSRMFEEYNETK